MKLYLIGDSLLASMQGLKEPAVNWYLSEIDGSLEIVNTAIPGENSEDLANRINLVVEEDHVDKIFILTGANDLARHKPDDIRTYEENIHHIISSLVKKYRYEDINLISIPPVDEYKQLFRTNTLVNSYNEILKSSAEQKGCKYLDLNYLFSNNDKYLVEDILEGMHDDGLHFGLKGYKILAQLIYENI